MRNKSLLLSILLFPLLVFASYQAIQEFDQDSVLMQILIDGLNAGHYEEHALNDDFSTKVYDLYMERLDFNKLFLTEKDVQDLEEFKYLLDDEAQEGSYEFFEKSEEIINARIDQAEGYYKEILSAPFDFDKDEYYESDPEKQEYAKNEKELKENWRLYLKYQTLTRMHNMLSDQENTEENSDTTMEILTVAEIEEKARGKVLKSQDEWFNRLRDFDTWDRRVMYLNAIAGTYDPHTVYLPPKDKENFDINMSGQLEGIGAQLQEKDDYIKVMTIIPGSACWKQGELEVSDVILKVAQGSEEPVDIVGMRIDDAVRLIRGKKGTEVRLTVRKTDGEIKVIPIIRDVVVLEETYAKSMIISEDGADQKFGLIHLPKFYADFNQKNGRHCSKDVKIELEKLTSQGVDGIILDLRNNGGGSLQDVVDMAGLFIPYGPIVQVKSRYGNPYVLSDTDPLVQYDGPLIVMVNSFSASASEILAAAMQDYNRAVIIGSESTFGKGTVQRFLSLDDMVTEKPEDMETLGVIKLTTQKFYRINGDATQLKGVTPDIILPDNWKYIDVGEREQDYPMEWDEIKAVVYEPWVRDRSYLDNLVAQSEQRVNDNEVFELIEENASRLGTQRDQTKYSLNLEQYRAYRKQLKDVNDKYKDIKQEIPEMNLEFLQADLPEIESDSSALARMEDWQKTLKKDIHLYESMHVMYDWLAIE